MYKVEVDPRTLTRQVITTRDYVIRTEFGLWLHKNFMRHGLTQRDAAIKLGISRASVCGHATGKVKPTFVNVIAYCWLFGGQDDPNEVWGLLDKTFEG